MGQLARDPDTYWYSAGLQIGKERAALDRAAGKRLKPEEHWIPEGSHPAWVRGLLEGYETAMLPRDPSYPSTTEF